MKICPKCGKEYIYAKNYPPVMVIVIHGIVNNEITDKCLIQYPDPDTDTRAFENDILDGLEFR